MNSDHPPQPFEDPPLEVRYRRAVAVGRPEESGRARRGFDPHLERIQRVFARHDDLVVG